MLEATEEQEQLIYLGQEAKILEAALEEQVKTFMRVMLVVLKMAALAL